MFVSVVVPVFNGRDHLSRSLSAIRQSDYPDFELIVVDDGSTDDSVELSRKFADSVLELEDRHAPGFARNSGARRAKGEILFFVDADVEIEPDTISRIAGEMKKNPQISAVFGSYDESPSEKNFFSQYKNLFHHFVHQRADAEARTFWAGCGAVRRDAFFKAGGFAENFATSSIEDVVLGYRMAELGFKIRLSKALQAKHLKKWTFATLVKTDIFHRAIPWSRLASQKGLPKDLNFRLSDRISAIAAWGFVISLCLFSFSFLAGIASLFFIAILLELNKALYAFFFRKRGLRFTAAAIIFHWFYFLYSSFIFSLFTLILRLPASSDTAYWSKVIAQEKKKPYEDFWRADMLVIYRDLLDRWLDPKESGFALMTDLYDVAISDYNPLPLLARRYSPVFGMDISYEAAQAACAKMPGHAGVDLKKTLVCDTRSLAFRSASFDLIFSNSTLDHFGKKENLKTALKECARVLKPGGTFLVALDNPLNPVVALRNLLPYAWLKSTGLIPYYMGRTMSRRELIGTLSSCGLEVLESAYINHAPRLLLIGLGRLFAKNKNKSLKDFFAKAIGELEKLSRWPSAPLTGYYVAVKAIKKK